MLHYLINMCTQADTRRAAEVQWTTVATWASVTTCHRELFPWFHRQPAARVQHRRATTSPGHLPPARRSLTALADPAWRLSIATTCPDRCSPSHLAARRPASPTMDPSADRTGTWFQDDIRWLNKTRIFHFIVALTFPRRAKRSCARMLRSDLNVDALLSTRDNKNKCKVLLIPFKRFCFVLFWECALIWD